MADEVRAMDVGRLTSQRAAYERFVERFGTPQQLAANYLEQSELPDSSGALGRRVAAVILLLAITTGGVCYAIQLEPPKLSPFTDVQFERDQVIVTYADQTYQWLELDGHKVEEIVASSKQQFGSRWQKRISEDLVEVLWGLNHKPGKTVKLRLLDLKTKEETVAENAPMTEENRSTVYAKRLKAEFLNERVPPKLSPFTDVRFEGEQMIVTYAGKTYQWLGLDDHKIEAIIASSKQQFGKRWQKRISEDLVEVLWGMGHVPDKTVKLRLLDPRTKRKIVTANAPLTESNRLAVYKNRLQAEDETQADPPKRSPFTEVSFKAEQVIVTYNDQNYQWLELDGFKVEDIIASAKKQFDGRWQKRISEDLVEVLWGMNHKPGNTVELRLLDTQTKRSVVVKDAPLTAENRQLVYRKRMGTNQRR